MRESKQSVAASQDKAKDDDWLDEVLRESFPASDPAPWRHKEEVDETTRAQDERSVTPG